MEFDIDLGLLQHCSVKACFEICITCNEELFKSSNEILYHCLPFEYVFFFINRMLLTLRSAQFNDNFCVYLFCHAEDLGSLRLQMPPA